MLWLDRTVYPGVRRTRSSANPPPGVAIIFSVPLGDFSGGQPDFAMAFGVADELTEQLSAERPATDEGMVTSKP